MLAAAYVFISESLREIVEFEFKFIVARQVNLRLLTVRSLRSNKTLLKDIASCEGQGGGMDFQVTIRTSAKPNPMPHVALPNSS